MLEGRKIPIHKPNLERVPFYSFDYQDEKGKPVPRFWLDFRHKDNKIYKARKQKDNLSHGYTQVQRVQAYDQNAQSAPVILKYGIPELLLSEARTQQKSHHFEFIPTVYDVGTFRPPYSSDDEVALLMEFIPNGRVANLTSETDRDILLDKQVIGIITQALSYIHLNDTAHLDMSQNIYLSETKVKNGKGKTITQMLPYLIDFDASSPVQTVKVETFGLGENGGLRGTNNFVSPEQIVAPIDVKKLSPDSDIYILGLMLYTILTGEILLATEVRDEDYFKKDTVYNAWHQEILMKRIRQHIPRDHFKRNSVSIDSNLNNIFKTVLHKLPELRSPKKRHNEKAPHFIGELYNILGL